MENDSEKRSVVSLNNEGFKQYLILRYVNESTNSQWDSLKTQPEGSIPSKLWIDLYQYAKKDMEPKGGRIVGFETVDEQLIRHEDIGSEEWPSNWMWVIESIVA